MSRHPIDCENPGWVERALSRHARTIIVLAVAVLGAYLLVSEIADLVN